MWADPSPGRPVSSALCPHSSGHRLESSLRLSLPPLLRSTPNPLCSPNRGGGGRRSPRRTTALPSPAPIAARSEALATEKPPPAPQGTDGAPRLARPPPRAPAPAGPPRPPCHRRFKAKPTLGGGLGPRALPLPHVVSVPVNFNRWRVSVQTPVPPPSSGQLSGEALSILGAGSRNASERLTARPPQPP